jgi:transposase
VKPKALKKQILKVTKEALADGVTLSEIASKLEPLVSRSVYYGWAKKWEKDGDL